MTVPDAVKSVKAACSDPDWDSEKIEITTNSQSVTFTTKMSSITDIQSLPSKNYEVTLNFYNSSNILLYSTTQSITVFAGMMTNKWYDSANSSSSPINNSEGIEPVKPVHPRKAPPK